VGAGVGVGDGGVAAGHVDGIVPGVARTGRWDDARATSGCVVENASAEPGLATVGRVKLNAPLSAPDVSWKLNRSERAFLSPTDHAMLVGSCPAARRASITRPSELGSESTT
jgi:hypothetical protein